MSPTLILAAIALIVLIRWMVETWRNSPQGRARRRRRQVRERKRRVREVMAGKRPL